MSRSSESRIEFVKIDNNDNFPTWMPRSKVAQFFHETMKPYHDTLEDVQAALDYALVEGSGSGGFLMLAVEEHELLGALLMLRTGMGGYVPEYLLLFVSVDPDTRGRGVGRMLIERAIEQCDGDVKLHVEYDNPAKRLYERIGFTTKYAEMRFNNRERAANG